MENDYIFWKFYVNTCISGTQYRNDDGSCRKELLDSVFSNNELVFKPDPMNSYDANAIKIILRDKCVGFVPKNLAGLLNKENVSYENPRLVGKKNTGVKVAALINFKVTIKLSLAKIHKLYGEKACNAFHDMTPYNINDTALRIYRAKKSDKCTAKNESSPTPNKSELMIIV